MKPLTRAITLAVTAFSLAILPPLTEAKRLGGGRPAGMQRQMPDRPAATPNQATPAHQNAAANPAGQQQAQQPAPVGAAAAAAAPAGKRSWLGPIAGLAAGLGLAALASHFGFGEQLANAMMMGLLVMAVLFAVRWFMSRRNATPAGASARLGEPALAGAGAGFGGAAPQGGWSAPAGGLTPSPVANAAAASTAAYTPPATLPGGMAHDEFVRLAKMVFVRMQAANDAGNVEDLRKFTTPELFASLRVDLQERQGAAQQTDVVTVNAEVVDVAREGTQDIVSVRYSGLVREERGATAEPFAELWHLVRPAAGGDWAIAGITPLQA